MFLPLRELSDVNKGLATFIRGQLDQPHLRMPVGFGKRLTKRGNFLFLLDGLDEVVDPEQRIEVAGWINDALTANPSCRFVVT